MLFDTINELDRLGRNLFSMVDQTIGAPVDIHREGDRYVIDADLPGVDPSSVDVTVEGQSLTIRAERSKTRTEEATDWVVRERGSWTFVRRFTLGDDIDPDGIEARYHDGVLTVAVPITEGARRHKVPVGIGAAGPKALGATSTKSEKAGRVFARVLRHLPWGRHHDGPTGRRMRGSSTVPVTSGMTR